MSTLRVNTLQNTSTTDGGISINNSGHVTVDGVAMPSSGPLSNRNLIINGAMQVYQRNTAATTNGALSLDRYKYEVLMDGACSVAQTTVTAGDAFTNGFRNALRVDVTTADTSLTGTQNIILEQRMEGQNLQSIAKGTSGAKEITLSFYVRGSTTGTYIAEMYDNDNGRSCSKSYTIDTADTWEYKTITYPADTTGTLDDDNASSLWVNWWLGAGTDFQSGTLQTTWATRVNANRVVGQTNLASSTSNYFEITGVQLEVGSVATPFEHRSFGDELARCRRYYISETVSVWHSDINGSNTTSDLRAYVAFPTTMRANPTVTATIGYTASNTSTTLTIQYARPTGFTAYPTQDQQNGLVLLGGYTASAEI